MEEDYYNDLVCQLHDLADEAKSIVRDEIIRRIREIAGPDLREVCNWERCEYESVTRCKDPKMPDSRLCTYHGTISAVRFDPRYK
jgi:hypothetical protein